METMTWMNSLKQFGNIQGEKINIPSKKWFTRKRIFRFFKDVGLVKEKSFTFKNQFALDGGHLNGFTRLWNHGELNAQRDNAILICHALTGDHHVAGVFRKWYKVWVGNHVVGPGKPIDTNKYFVICSNCLGACRGSTGPSTMTSEDLLHGANFPDLSIGDMVRAQKLLLEHLSVFNLFAVVGGSMGGMQALQWIFEYPDFSKKAIIIAATAQHSVQTIAFNEQAGVQLPEILIKGRKLW